MAKGKYGGSSKGFQSCKIRVHTRSTMGRKRTRNVVVYSKRWDCLCIWNKLSIYMHNDNIFTTNCIVLNQKHFSARLSVKFVKFRKICKTCKTVLNSTSVWQTLLQENVFVAFYFKRLIHANIFATLGDGCQNYDNNHTRTCKMHVLKIQENNYSMFSIKQFL